MNTEEDRSKYRIHKAVVESYNSRPYEFTVLKDLIEGKWAFDYCIILRFILLLSDHQHSTYSI